MNPNMMFDLHKYHHATWEEWAKYKREVIKQRVIDTIDRGVREGYFRSDLNKDILATLRVEQLELAFNDSVFPHEKNSLEEVQLQLFDHFIYGCLNRKGFDLYEETKKKMSEQEPIPTK
jgi:hypothetical protein